MEAGAGLWRGPIGGAALRPYLAGTASPNEETSMTNDNTAAAAAVAPKPARNYDSSEVISLAAFVVIPLLTNLFFFAQALPHAH
jgi:hypothetical protein